MQVHIIKVPRQERFTWVIQFGRQRVKAGRTFTTTAEAKTNLAALIVDIRADDFLVYDDTQVVKTCVRGTSSKQKSGRRRPS